MGNSWFINIRFSLFNNTRYTNSRSTYVRAELLNNSIIYYGNGLLKACDASSKTNMLPLPIDEPVSEKIIEATLLGHSKATRSHGFFKTDKDANVQKNRTFWQKAAGFFGGEVIEKGQEKPDFNNINTGTQWSQITSS